MKNNLILTIAILLISISFISAAGSMVRTVPTSAQSSSSISITYQATSSGVWGASIVDSVSGGCKFPDGTTQLKSVMLSPDGNTKTITITTPSSGSCTFTGDYKFGNDAIVNFPSATLSIGGATCTAGTYKCEDNAVYICYEGIWETDDNCVQKGMICQNNKCVLGTCTPSCSGKVCGDNGCGGSCGTCSSGKTCSSGQCITGTCTPDCACASNTNVGSTCSDGCSGTCQGIKTIGTTTFDLDKWFGWAAWFDINSDKIKNGTDGLIIVIIGIVGGILIASFFG